MAVLLNQSTKPPIIQPLGVTLPWYYDTIVAPDGTTIIWSLGDTVTFFMRPLLSRVPVVTNPATTISPPDDEGNNVYYPWASGDVAVEGEFMGWWGYVLSGGQLAETPEFRIIITDHGPGYGVSTGVIVDAISMWMPTTLARLRESPEFGDRFLQAHADYVKRVVMGVVVAPDLEVDYDPALVEYLSKRTAIRLITPAKDYWARQYRQVSSQGPSEQATYPDMLANLDALCHRLHHEVVADWRQLQRLVPGLPQLRVEPAPASSLGDPSSPLNGPVTRDPNQTQRERTGGPRWNLFLP